MQKQIDATSKKSPTPTTTFNIDYLKKNLSLIDVSVPSYETDFQDHINYKIVFTQEPKQNIFITGKRFNDFVALHDVIKMKFQNIEMKSFPSRFQIFNKSQTRRAYFDQMMKRLLKAAKQHQEIRHQILSMIISFVNLKNKAAKQDVIKDKSASKQSIFSYDEQTQTTIASSQTETSKQVSEKIIDYAVIKAEEQQRLIDEGQLKVEDKTNMIMVKFQDENEWKNKYLRIKEDRLEVYRSIAYSSFQTQIQLYGMTVEYLTKDPTILDQLMLKMEFRDDMPVYPPNYQYLSLYHQYDSKKLLLTIPEATSDKPCQALQDLRIRLKKASQYAHFSQYYKGFFNDAGKIYIAIYGFKLIKDIASIVPEKSKDGHNQVIVKIKTQAFSYQTKKVELRQQSLIRQGFIIPVTNVFEQITIQLVQVQMKGWIKQQQKQRVLGRYILRMSDILSYNRGYNFQKVVFRVDEIESGASIASMTATIRNLSQLSSMYTESFASQNDGQYINYEQMTIRQTLSSVTATIERLLFVIGKIALFFQTTWRNIYCFKYPRLATLALFFIALGFIFLDMSNLMVFFTIGLCSVIIYNHKSIRPLVEQTMDKFLTGDAHKHFDYKNPRTIGIKQFKYMKWAHNHIQLKERLLQKSSDPSINIQNPARGESNFEKTKRFFFLKKQGNLFKVEDKNIDQGIIDKFQQIKLTIQQVHNSINSTVNLIQKIGSLFSWVDFRRTLYFFLIVISMIILSNAVAFRFLGVALCIHRFIKGMRYYKKHYANNRKLAEQCLKYILNKSFKDIKKQLQTKQSIEKVPFPIQEEDFKTLKQQLQNLIPVCINASEMNEIQEFIKKIQKNQKQTLEKKVMSEKYLPYIEGDKIRLAFFIDMIQSCETRLRLNNIITNEGRTQEYQDLRQVTKQRPVLDIWIQNLIKNYILNTPSLFYDYLHRSSDSIVYPHKELEPQKINVELSKDEPVLAQPPSIA